MAKKKRRLTAAQRAAKKKLRAETQTVFVGGRMKRVRRPPAIDGLPVEEFIRRNADAVFLHQAGLREYLEEPEEDTFPPDAAGFPGRDPAGP
jgi:hypothetical protein